jgi:hypothetical protein
MNDSQEHTMSDANEQFAGFSDNAYQHLMHSLANITLWSIIIIGVAAGIFGFVWGQTH